MLFNRFFYFLVVLMTPLFLNSFLFDAFAASKEERVVESKKVGEARSTNKSLTGTISYVDKKYISIVIGADRDIGLEREVGFWVDEGVQEGWSKKLSEMKRGDQVQISYEEIEQDYDERTENGNVKRAIKIDELKAKNVKFLSPEKTSLTSD